MPPKGIRNYVIGLVLATGADHRFVLGRERHGAALHPGRSDGAGGFGGRADGRASRLLPAHHHRSDNLNNALALAFGALIVGLVIAGSLWIMYHLNGNMMIPAEMMDMHMQK